MKGLKQIFTKFQDAMTAAAFAEAGESETAIKIVNEGSRKGNMTMRVTGRKNIVLKPNHT